MKHTILGFNQADLLTYELDLVDAAILRWFADFVAGGAMETATINNVQYYWVLYKYVLLQLPIIGIDKNNTRSLARRFDKYSKCKILNKHTAHRLKGRNGTFTLFSPTRLLYQMTYSKEDTPCTQKYTPPVLESTPPPVLESTPKDSSVINSSISDRARPRAKKNQARQERNQAFIQKLYGGQS